MPINLFFFSSKLMRGKQSSITVQLITIKLKVASLCSAKPIGILMPSRQIMLCPYRAFGNTAVLASFWDWRCSLRVLRSLWALVSSSFSCWHSLTTVVDWDCIASTLLCNDASMFVRASGAVLQLSPASSVMFISLVRSVTDESLHSYFQYIQHF